MKRKIALLALLVMVCATLLTACNQVVATDIVTRWDNKQYVFNISLADFDKTASLSDVTYKREILGATATARESLVFDQVKPHSLSGTYTLNVSLSADNLECTVTTKQEMFATYPTELLQSCDCWQDLQQFVTQSDEALTTLKSTYDTSVTFKQIKSQQPIRSSQSCKGFYIGEVNQSVSIYDVTTEYNFNNNTADVTLNGVTTTEKLNVTRGRNFIDSNQILMYARSLDKNSGGFQDNPSVVVFDALYKKCSVANFGMTYSSKVVLNVAGEDFCTSLNTVSVAVDGAFLMQTENLPNTLKAKLLDIHNDTAGSSRFTIVRFRSGNVAYELADYATVDGWNDIATELLPSASGN